MRWAERLAWWTISEIYLSKLIEELSAATILLIDKLKNAELKKAQSFSFKIYFFIVFYSKKWYHLLQVNYLLLLIKVYSVADNYLIFLCSISSNFPSFLTDILYFEFISLALPKLSRKRIKLILNNFLYHRKISGIRRMGLHINSFIMHIIHFNYFKKYTKSLELKSFLTK